MCVASLIVSQRLSREELAKIGECSRFCGLITWRIEDAGSGEGLPASHAWSNFGAWLRQLAWSLDVELTARPPEGAGNTTRISMSILQG